MAASSHPTKDQNPDYYAETASLGPTPAHLAQDVPPPQPPRPAAQAGAPGGYPPPPPPPPQQQQQPQHYFPPPPTAPAPSNAHSAGGSHAAQPGGGPSAAPPAGSAGKPTFGERLYQWSIKAGVPINKVTNKLGSEAFWPSSMDLECEKAGRILKSFCSMFPPS